MPQGTEAAGSQVVRNSIDVAEEALRTNDDAVTHPTRYRRMSEAALVGVAFVWGVTFVLVQDAIALVPVMTFLAYRFLIAGSLMVVWSHKSLRALSRRGWLAGATLGVLVAAGYVTQTFGLVHTTSSNAGFITGLSVVLTPLFGALVTRRGLPLALWLAIAIAALGLYLLSGTSGHFSLNGDGLVLLCACAFACHILVTDRVTKGFGTQALVSVQLCVCGVLSMAVATALGQLSVPRDPRVWLALAVTSIFASALAFFIQTFAQRNVAPERTALILASEPVFAGISGFVFHGDRLTILAWVGALLILGAICWTVILQRSVDFKGTPSVP